MTRTYSTRTEAIQREIVEPIMAGDVESIDEYDVETIAAEVLGDYARGYALQVDEASFWASVERNAHAEIVPVRASKGR